MRISYFSRVFRSISFYLLFLMLFMGFVTVNDGVLAFDSQEDDGGAFVVWRESFMREAVHVGISPVTVQAALMGVEPDPRVVALDRKQPERTQSFVKYLANTMTKGRLVKGRALLGAHRKDLEEASVRYGVPASVIVTLWGIESGFGQNMGGFSVVRSLATLAFEGRRADFFRNELLEALRVLDEEGMTSENLLGSWAGAMGQCQFMPSTYRKFAVDKNGDGYRDIWGDRGDVFASIARYLAAEGWRPGQSWGREVRLTKLVPPHYLGLDQTKSLEAWGRLGVVDLQKKKLPHSQIIASLIQPDGRGGRSFLVYDNFRAVMRWNRSTYFALGVGMMSDRVRH